MIKKIYITNVYENGAIVKNEKGECKKKVIIFEPIKGLMNNTVSINDIMDSYNESLSQYEF